MITEITSLSDLAQQIQIAHVACESSVQQAFQHGVDAGELLAQVKEKLKHGEWADWLEANFKGSARTARTYLALAANRHRFENGSAPPKSIRAAMQAIASDRISTSIQDAAAADRKLSLIERAAQLIGEAQADFLESSDRYSAVELKQIIDACGEVQNLAAKLTLRDTRELGKLIAEHAPKPDYTHFLDMKPEHRHQLVTLWWDQLAKYALLFSTAGYSVDAIADLMQVPTDQVRVILSPTRRPVIGWSESDWTEANRRWFDSEIERGIFRLLDTAYGHAIYAGEIEGLGTKVIADLASQRKHSQRKIECLSAGEEIDFKDPQLAAAVKCAISEEIRIALLVEQPAEPQTHISLLIAKWHILVKKNWEAA